MQAAKRAGWLPENENEIPQAKHVGFGLVLGADGKRFRTRSTEVVRLVDLLDEAKDRSKTGLIERGSFHMYTISNLRVLIVNFIYRLLSKCSRFKCGW